MIETVIGIKAAVVASVMYIINTLALHCVIIKWLNNDIKNFLFHFLHDEHDIKHSIEDEANFSSYINSTNFTSLKLKEIVIVNLDLTSSTFNLKEILINFVVFLLLFLSYCLNFSKNNVNNETRKKIEQESSDVFIETTGIDSFIETKAYESAVGSHVVVKNRLSNSINSRFMSACSILIKLLFFAILIILLTLSISWKSFRLVVKCEEFFKNGFHMVCSLNCKTEIIFIEYFSI